MYPATYRYTKEHEWVNVDGDVGVVGITDHAQKELGDIVFVELPKPGTPQARVQAGKAFGSVESVKTLSEVFSPITGEIIEVNSALTEAPELVNQDPHGAAWLVKVRIEKPEELNELMSAAEYEEYLGTSSR